MVDNFEQLYDPITGELITDIAAYKAKKSGNTKDEKPIVQASAYTTKRDNKLEPKYNYKEDNHQKDSKEESSKKQKNDSHGAASAASTTSTTTINSTPSYTSNNTLTSNNSNLFKNNTGSNLGLSNSIMEEVDHIKNEFNKITKNIKIAAEDFSGGGKSFFNRVMKYVKKGITDYKDLLSATESNGNQHAVNQYGYKGLYQMGNAALQTAGMKNKDGSYTAKAAKFGVHSDSDFLNSKACQDAAIEAYTHQNWKTLCRMGLDKFVGKEFSTGDSKFVITEEALLYAAHLKGPGGVKKLLVGGKDNADANGIACSVYLAIGAHVDEGSLNNPNNRNVASNKATGKSKSIS